VKIGDLLIDMRMQSGKTQKQIADRIGVNVKTLRDYEREESEIPAPKLLHVISFCRYDLVGIIKAFTKFDQEDGDDDEEK
jgi:transcriptional regulator with XRE-family HTH domain